MTKLDFRLIACVLAIQSLEAVADTISSALEGPWWWLVVSAPASFYLAYLAVKMWRFK